jgi:hypothetical protein
VAVATAVALVVSFISAILVVILTRLFLQSNKIVMLNPIIIKAMLTEIIANLTPIISEA